MQKVIFIGNVGKDPEVKEFENGGKVANFTVAVTERGYKAEDGTEIQDRSEWFNCVARKGLATVVGQYVKKGNKVYVEGKIRTRKYEKDGQNHELKEIIVDSLELLTPKSEGSAQPQPSQPQPSFAPQQENDGLPF